MRLPWRIRRLPSAVPLVTAAVFFLSALLKLFAPGYLCGPNPWEKANLAMIPLEFALAYSLWKERRRELGGLLGCATMAGAAALLSWAHFTGRDVRTCGCFGPIEMSYEAHLVVIAALFASCSLTLISSAPPPTQSPSTDPRGPGGT